MKLEIKLTEDDISVFEFNDLIAFLTKYPGKYEIYIKDTLKLVGDLNLLSKNAKRVYEIWREKGFIKRKTNILKLVK